MIISARGRNTVQLCSLPEAPKNGAQICISPSLPFLPAPREQSTSTYRVIHPTQNTASSLEIDIPAPCFGSGHRAGDATRLFQWQIHGSKQNLMLRRSATRTRSPSAASHSSRQQPPSRLNTRQQSQGSTHLRPSFRQRRSQTFYGNPQQFCVPYRVDP